MNKTRDEILVELYQTKFVENFARKFCGKADMVYFDDIVAELYLILCEMPASKLVAVYYSCDDRSNIDCLRRFVAGVIVHQLRSKESRIYLRYTRHVYRQKPTDLWLTENAET